jgi:hypothetical protein
MAERLWLWMLRACVSVRASCRRRRRRRRRASTVVVVTSCVPNAAAGALYCCCLYLLQVDSDGIQKIWDVRKFQCLQTIDTSFEGTTAFCYVPPVKAGSRKRTAGVVTGTKSLHVFKQDVATGQGLLSLTDDKPVNHVRVLGNQVCACLCVCVERMGGGMGWRHR